MALYTVKGAGNIPEGGIRLSKEEALEFQKKVIKKWKSHTDVVFLEFGWLASSAVTFSSSVYITRMIRSLLNINSQVKFVSHVVSGALPTLMSGVWTEKRVTESSLLMSTGCPMCLQMRFGLAQIIFGVALPTGASLAFHLPVAHYYKTISLPDISQDTRKAYQFCFKLLKSRVLQFQILATLQIPLIVLLPYLQEKQLDKINKLLRERNENLD